MAYKFIKLSLTTAPTPENFKKPFYFKKITEFERPEGEYDLIGLYKFNDKIDNYTDSTVETSIKMDFLSNGTTYSHLIFHNNIMYYYGNWVRTEAYNFNTDTWNPAVSQFIKFTTSQIVGVNVYNWIDNNMTKWSELQPPALSLLNTDLTITSAVEVTKFIIYVNYEEAASVELEEGTKTYKFDLATLNLTSGTYAISVAVGREGRYVNSPPSATVQYTIAAPVEPTTSLADTMWYLDADWQQPTDNVSTGKFDEPLAYLNTVPIYGFKLSSGKLGYYTSASSENLAQCQLGKSITLSFTNVDDASDFYTDGELLTWLKNNGTQIKNLNSTTWKLSEGWQATKGYGQFDINGKIIPAANTKQFYSFNKIGIGYNDVNSEEQNGLYSYNAALKISQLYTNNNIYYINIIDGEDIINAALMAWLGQYGTIDKTAFNSTDITFAIANTTYFAPANSTWESWCADTAYNKNHFWIYEDIVVSGEGRRVQYDGQDIHAAELISADRGYTLTIQDTIEFYIDNIDTKALAIPGSNFGAWVSSSYNRGYHQDQNGYIVKGNKVLTDSDDGEHVSETTVIEAGEIYYTKYQELPSQNQGSLTLTWADSATLNNYTVEVQ